MLTSLAFLLFIAAPPDLADGRAAFNDPGIGKYGVACATCHATVQNEEKEGDGLIRPGAPLWGVAKRKYWRGDEKKSAYPTLADAVDVCVQMFQGGPPLTGRERLAIDTFLRALGPKDPQPPLKIEPELEADLNYDREKYHGGDVERGRRVFFRSCHACHPKGGEGVAGSLRGKSIAEVATKVREGNGMLRGTRKGSDWMPFYGANRLSDKQVADIAAYVGALGK